MLAAAETKSAALRAAQEQHDSAISEVHAELAAQQAASEAALLQAANGRTAALLEAQAQHSDAFAAALAEREASEAELRGQIGRASCRERV